MSEYTDQAKKFLADCNAEMEIKFVGKEIPSNWKGETNPHNKYQFTITTPRGNYSSYFWDSLHNTEISELLLEQYAVRYHRRNLSHSTSYEKRKWKSELRDLQNHAVPTEYDILACLEKYGYDSFSDFCYEFGYDDDSICAMKTYIACNEEYAGLRRVFTNEQMEQLREIN